MKSVLQLAAPTPQQRSDNRSRSIPTKPLTDQHAAQLAAQPLGEPVCRNVQLAALDHAVLYLHMQLGGAASTGSIVRQFQDGLDAEFRRPTECPLPATQLRRRPAESRKRWLISWVNKGWRSAETELCRLGWKLQIRKCAQLYKHSDVTKYWHSHFYITAARWQVKPLEIFSCCLNMLIYQLIQNQSIHT